MPSMPHTPMTKVIDACYGELRAFARRKVGSMSLAEDLVQEAMARFAATDGARNPRALLYRILGNLVIDHRRRERTRTAVVDDGADGLEQADASANVEAQVAARQELALIEKAVAELPPRCRECFVLRRFHDLSQAEIAERMGISRNMVEKHLRNATLHCARKISGNE